MILLDYNVIAKNRHPDLLAKESIWKQIELNYYGGTGYRDANPSYLHRYPKESIDSYNSRKNRSILYNQLAPIVDMLVGFLFSSPPDRSNTEKVKYLIENAGRNRDIDSFMRVLGKWSLMFTTGVLVDSPNFASEDVQTEQQRIDAKLNPYCVMYKPFDIRNFSIDRTGELYWVLLDNSYYNNKEPYDEPETVYEYRLWTREGWHDFIIGDDGGVKAGATGTHPLGYVPFKFVSWRDDNQDMITESFCEDLALINQGIYNMSSFFEEMVASGTIKMMFYPAGTGELPAELKAGTGPLSIIPFDANYSQKPFFDGPKLEDASSYIEAMHFLMIEFLKKVGMETDEAKDFVKSGKARKLDFEKVKTVLSAGASSLEQTEDWIFKTARKWEGAENTATVVYNKDFLSEDVDTKLARFAEMAMLPYESMTKTVHRLMAQAALSNDIEPDEMEVILKEIDNYSPPERPNVDDLINNETGEDDNATSNE